MEDVDAIVREFVAETQENLAQLERDLVALEQEPGSRDLIASIFRTVHTVKGTCGFLGFARLEELSHAGENLLSRWRDGTIEPGAEPIDLLLRVVDGLRALLTTIDATGADATGPDVAATVADVTRFLDDVDARVEAPTAPPPSPEVAPAPPPEEPVTAVAVASEPPAAPDPAAAPGRVGEDSVRVGVEVLDALMRQVGELVLARNRLGRVAAESRQPELVGVSSTIRSVVNELQSTVMKTRMQPVSHAWQATPRLVRDLASQLGKPLELVTKGGDTELDRTLVDVLRDPLTHLVRNAADHGIEPTEHRESVGKPATGTITLEAWQQGGSLVLVVSDDGQGIDLDAVVRQAQARGLASADELARMSDDQLVQLVFHAGFSTSAAVSTVSGRGVGMDVVKSAVEAVGGSVHLTSRPGLGTSCRLSLPVTLAVTPSVTVEVCDQRFVIPQADLRELVRVDTHSLGVEDVSGAPVYRLRDQLVPVLVLAEVLDLRQDGLRTGSIAVLQVADRTLGLLVDAVLDTEEIVVEPLDARVGPLGIYGGSAILGDGRVALVLDAAALAARATSDGADDRTAAAPVEPADSTVVQPLRQYVVAVVNGGRRVALPMDRVTRLEDFAASAVEHVGRRDVVQYRGAVVPLLRLGRYLDRRTDDDSPTPLARTLPSVVYRVADRTVVVAVDTIVDIVDDADEVPLTTDDGRIAGALVIDGQVTELVDVERALAEADPELALGTHATDDLDSRSVAEVAS